jgi:hypothetical protein
MLFLLQFGHLASMDKQFFTDSHRGLFIAIESIKPLPYAQTEGKSGLGSKGQIAGFDAAEPSRGASTHETEIIGTDRHPQSLQSQIYVLDVFFVFHTFI